MSDSTAALPPDLSGAALYSPTTPPPLGSASPVPPSGAGSKTRPSPSRSGLAAPRAGAAMNCWLPSIVRRVEQTKGGR
jgi:hypothetical protein